MDFEDNNNNQEEEGQDEEEEELNATEIPTSAVVAPPSPQPQRVRYRECLKNHAVGLGGHAVDGCGEFLPAGPEGSLEGLKCAACGCHRNFHRKEAEPATARVSSAIVNFTPPQLQGHQFFPHHQPTPFSPYYRPPPAGYLQVTPTSQRPLALPSTSGGGGSQSRSEEMEDMWNPSSFGGVSGSSRKRFRTKFTQDQKDKMMSFAESIGWRIQRQDDEIVNKFCHETGVRRHVLKVWMHNNKNTLGKKVP